MIFTGVSLVNANHVREVIFKEAGNSLYLFTGEAARSRYKGARIQGYEKYASK